MLITKGEQNSIQFLHLLSTRTSPSCNCTAREELEKAKVDHDKELKKAKVEYEEELNRKKAIFKEELKKVEYKYRMG